MTDDEAEETESEGEEKFDREDGGKYGVTDGEDEKGVGKPDTMDAYVRREEEGGEEGEEEERGGG